MYLSYTCYNICVILRGFMETSALTYSLSLSKRPSGAGMGFEIFSSTITPIMLFTMVCAWPCVVFIAITFKHKM